MKALITLLLLLAHGVYAQVNRSAHWYFGYEAGIDFSTGVPVTDISGKLTSLEGCCSISDTMGNLLCYSNGVSVWNKNHLLMPNGMGLTGNESSAQSSLLVPLPGNNSLYYLFSTAGGLPSDGLRYSIIDMNLAGGLGDVTAIKNVPLHLNGTEELAGTKQCNHEDYWVVGRQRAQDTLRFYAYPLTRWGIGSAVVSEFAVPSDRTDVVGSITISQDGKTICFSSTVQPVTYVFDFDYASGQLTMRNSINLLPNEQVYSNALSPDASKLYISSWTFSDHCRLSQFDLLASNITASRTDLRSINFMMGSPNGYGFIGQVRLAPDQKIYVSRWHQQNPYLVHPSTFYSLDSLDVIHQPNQAGVASNFQSNFLYLQQKPTQLGLPNFISNFTAAQQPLPICTEDKETIPQMPNVFTPNGDGANDFFHPVSMLGVNSFNLVIFDRWGNKVFVTSEVLPGWDGKYQGKNCADGSYFWTFTYTNQHGETKNMKGHVNLFK